MNLFSSKSSIGTHHYNSLLRNILILLLIAALPIIIWAVRTQQTDIRKKAAYSQSCFNRVIPLNGSFSWPNGCKGNPDPTLICAQITVPLTSDELTLYTAWVAAGRPAIAGCAAELTPTPTITPIPPQSACTTNADCGCGIDKTDNQCAIENVQYLGPAHCMIPDYCTGSSGNCAPACMQGACRLYCPPLTPIPTATITPTPSPAVTPQVMKFKVKFAGVQGNGAEGAKISVKFQRDTTTVQMNNPLPVTHIGNGVYEATAVISNPLTAGNGYAIIIKGEKHLARKFCKSTGQTTACVVGDSITINAPSTVSQMFDFTGMPLEPGDLPPQDGLVGQSDFDKIKELQAKPSDQLTASDLVTGDLNYDHAISTWDIFWMRKTLETKIDEQ